MTPVQADQLANAAIALCCMRQKDPCAQVSETVKRTWQAQYFIELTEAMQAHIALRDQGLLK